MWVGGGGGMDGGMDDEMDGEMDGEFSCYVQYVYVNRTIVL